MKSQSTKPLSKFVNGKFYQGTKATIRKEAVVCKRLGVKWWRYSNAIVCSHDVPDDEPRVLVAPHIAPAAAAEAAEADADAEADEAEEE